ncbi:pyridoxal-phosphate dependent enzyme (plasmid) [Bosea sp. F3-2]|uniref:threonine synthase n=1 Tax=Bosea sp. F3-2 TaxID=2599640 RepID=UPI0011ED0999|nr:pyridoxal-phosphate dependent enzyme [Bosea sp. F3-2]QEL27064.1 pyridoxal-phosphate dependent enzyme [Bosea sp. F3-2]
MTNTAEAGADTQSRAIGQRSLGPDATLHPLYPVFTSGAPLRSQQRWNYPLEVAFDYSGVDPSVFHQPPLAGIARWAPLLPPLDPRLSFGEGGTPLIPISTAATASEIPVFLKDESRNPTWSHKDRLNLCTVSAAVRSGAKGVVVASSGNHGVSTAAYAARANLPCVVLTPSEISKTFLAMLRAYGACPVPVETAHRWPLVQAICERAGYHPTSNLTPFHTGHPFGPEGYKTIAYEIFLQFGRAVPAAVVVPTGYGEQLYGISKGFKELVTLGLCSNMPRMFSVEPATRGPLHRAVQTHEPMATVEAGETRQYSIACTASGYRGVLALEASRGMALTVDDASVCAAQATLGRQGIWQEFSACAAFAALPQILTQNLSGPIVLIGTSGGFKDPIEAETLPVVGPGFEHVADYVRQKSGIDLRS